MKRVLRLMPFVVVMAAAAIALGAGSASGGNGSKVLRGTFDTYGFNLNPALPFITFTCNEQRVQKPDGSATESATCQLDPGQTPPATALQLNTDGYISDFWYFGPVPGFAGGIFSTDFHGVLTPSGNLNFSATYAAS